MIDSLLASLAHMPPMARFAVGMALIFGVPRLCRGLGVPDVVGLLLAGVAFGPHGLDVFGDERPIADFVADLGKLMMMFFSGLEIDLVLFRERRVRAIVFGVLTAAIPFALGTQVARWLGYGTVPAIVVGSLLASQTLIGMPIVRRLGASRLEPMVVMVGATVLSDTLSLLVFAICVPMFAGGFSWPALAAQMVEVVVFAPLVLFALSLIGARLLKRLEDEEDGYFILLLGILVAGALLAQAIDLPGIVGSFLAGLAVNAAVRDKPAASKLQFFGNSLFIPMFFISTGFVIDPLVFGRTLVDHAVAAGALVGALVVGKWLAAETAGLAFAYTRPARLTLWSLSLPQVAATLAATLVAFQTLDPAHHRLLDQRMLNSVLVLMLTSSILGPLLTQRYAPRMLAASSDRGTQGRKDK